MAHILLQVRESVGELTEGMTEEEWNRRPANVASCAFHLRHITGSVDRLFTYARAGTLTDDQRAWMKAEKNPLTAAELPTLLAALSDRIDACVAELKTIDPATLGDFRGVGRAQLPSTVIGLLVHAAEHGMRHVGQLSVTARIVRATTPGTT